MLSTLGKIQAVEDGIRFDSHVAISLSNNSIKCQLDFELVA